jgi:hypothetical protein
LFLRAKKGGGAYPVDCSNVGKGGMTAYQLG